MTNAVLETQSISVAIPKGMFGKKTPESKIDRQLKVVANTKETSEGLGLHFETGEYGEIPASKPGYPHQVSIARQSESQQRPVGVRFCQDKTVEVFRATSDIPLQVSLVEDDNSLEVYFRGQDGIFHLETDHPEFDRLLAILTTATKHQLRVWFISRETDLAILDVLEVGWRADDAEGSEVSFFMKIDFITAPEHIVKMADRILLANLQTTRELKKTIRAVAKAYIDEDDELRRSIRDIASQSQKVQLATISPPDMIEKAKSLLAVPLANKSMQDMVQRVAQSYVFLAQKNQEFLDAFKTKYKAILPLIAKPRN
jgi:hypothetical protein